MNFVYTRFSYFFFIFTLSSNNPFFCFEFHRFTRDSKLLKMGWCLESLFAKKFVSPRDYADLPRVVSQQLSIIIRVLWIMTTILLLMHCYNIMGQSSHNKCGSSIQLPWWKRKGMILCLGSVLLILSKWNKFEKIFFNFSLYLWHIHNILFFISLGSPN